MRTIATAWEARATDVNQYSAAGITFPAATTSITGLSAILSPTYVKQLPVYDGWSTAFLQGSTTSSYAVKSVGADKTDNTASLTSAAAAITTGNFDCDIIYSDGTFVQYPEGVQSQ